MNNAEKRKLKKQEFYTNRDVSTWNWLDFLKYWNNQYLETFGYFDSGISAKDNPRLKGMIAPSLEKHGPETFKDMIDWLFANYKSYPKLKDLSIGLVCGNHYWANIAAEKVAVFGEDMSYLFKE